MMTTSTTKQQNYPSAIFCLLLIATLFLIITHLPTSHQNGDDDNDFDSFSDPYQSILHSVIDTDESLIDFGQWYSKVLTTEQEQLGRKLISGVNDDFYRNVTELIEARGFPYEQHYVTTSDGHILSLQRIPHGRNSAADNYGGASKDVGRTNKGRRRKEKKVVLLQHGLLDASETWVQNFETQSLAFVLADAGFDVWLGNVRGNLYSNRHVKYDPKRDKEFWNWSFDEMALVDLPAMIEYVLRATGRKHLDGYIGHSQGTIMGFACFSSGVNCSTLTMTDMSSHVKHFFALAPVAIVKNVRSRLLQWMASVRADEWLVRAGYNHFLPSNKWLQRWVPHLCHNTLVGQPFCAQIYCAFSGCNSLREHVNQTRLSTYFSHLPAGTSIVNIGHWSQMVRTGRFEMLDMGTSERNWKRYGQESPPLYDLSKLNIDVSMFYGGVDSLGTVDDLKSWLPLLPKSRVKRVQYLPTYGHLDVVWGINAHRDIYRHIVEQLQLE